MPVGVSAAIPHPSNLVEGYGPLYTRRVAYKNSSGEIEGDRLEALLFCGVTTAAVKGGVYRIAYDGDEESNPKAVACTAQTIDQLYCVATAATLENAWGWFAVQGYVDALVDGGTDVAKDDFLKNVAATDADALVKDGTSLSADTIAIACEAETETPATLNKVYLIGRYADTD